MSEGMAAFELRDPDPPTRSPRRCSPATGWTRPTASRSTRPTDLLGLGPPGRRRQRPAQRRPRALLRQPAHQSDQRLRAAEHLRLLLVRAHAEGRGRVHPLARGGLRTRRSRRAACRRASSTSSAGSHPKLRLELLHRHAPRAQGAPSRTCTSRRSPRSRSRTSRGSRRSASATCSSRCGGGARPACPAAAPRCSAPAVRATIAERKLTGEEWIRVHRDRARARHPHQLHDALRPRRDRARTGSSTSRCCATLQDETGGFLTYIPLAYHPDHNELGEELGRVGTATTGLRGPQEHRRRAAVPRQRPAHQDPLAHGDAVPLADRAAASACDDVEGTVVHERIYHEAGAHTADAHALPRAGAADPRRGEAAGRARQPLPAGARAVRRSAARAVAPPGRRAAGGARRMRLGRIPWINCYPVYGAIDRGVVPRRRRSW